MHFPSVALLACAAGAAASAEAQPYPLAVMPVPGLSLVSRDANGYKPEQQHCGKGNTCAEACGAGFDQCAATSGVAHCYNPAAGQSCCVDGSGNSCDAGYYCTHDHSKQTWCCPNAMDLVACAAAFSVSGGLEQARSTTAPPTTSTTPATTSSSPSSTPVVTETKASNTTVSPVGSAYSSARAGSNGTVTGAYPQPSGPAGTASKAPTAAASNVSAAAATGFSALLLVAAGVFALL
ncbi:Uncharacterized protein TCAP_06319 [Tolypocladium capitatum]|uniref:Prp 4 CRoW domain-containing protein n=1 Tax=Tolypocladium capitatum TaxID=45235 RepID=A0A2K3Q848_9HYPO|nr:Uncharacterized protein TCAP_06319 [Tolypocladium capitatum]